jgi:NAD(P)-dependent dehydrogenase (short-subunit alcohol dehydrogenase family)
MTGRLAGKVAVVTGAASGIGAACATAMAAEGASVIIADVDRASAEARASTIRDAGGAASPTVFDASGGDNEFAALFSHAIETYGRIDVVQNNAVGVRPPQDAATQRLEHYIEQTDERWFDAMLHGTATATMLGIKHAVPALRAAGGGSIINTASIAGMHGEIYLPGYGAGKAAVIQLTRAAAAMYGRDRIRCNAICPGLILTGAGQAAFSDDERVLMIRHTPLGRVGAPEDVGPLAVYLASEESRHMTGQALVLDGGFTMHEPAWADRLDLDDTRGARR